MKKPMDSLPCAEEIISWLVDRLAAILDCDQEKISPDAQFASLGLDSVVAVMLTDELIEQWSLDIDPQIFNDFPTINSLVDFLVNQS